MFLGNPSARVRDELWQKAVKAAKAQGSVLQIWTANSPQGFSYREFGPSDRNFVDFEGLALVRRTRVRPGPAKSGDTTVS